MKHSNFILALLCMFWLRGWYSPPHHPHNGPIETWLHPPTTNETGLFSSVVLYRIGKALATPTHVEFVSGLSSPTTVARILNSQNYAVLINFHRMPKPHPNPSQLQQRLRQNCAFVDNSQREVANNGGKMCNTEELASTIGVETLGHGLETVFIRPEFSRTLYVERNDESIGLMREQLPQFFPPVPTDSALKWLKDYLGVDLATIETGTNGDCFFTSVSAALMQLRATWRGKSVDAKVLRKIAATAICGNDFEKYPYPRDWNSSYFREWLFSEVPPEADVYGGGSESNWNPHLLKTMDTYKMVSTGKIHLSRTLIEKARCAFQEISSMGDTHWGGHVDIAALSRSLQLGFILVDRMGIHFHRTWNQKPKYYIILKYNGTHYSVLGQLAYRETKSGKTMPHIKIIYEPQNLPYGLLIYDAMMYADSIFAESDLKDYPKYYEYRNYVKMKTSKRKL